MTSSKLGLVSTLFDYTVWAFDQVWGCVDELTDEQFCMEIDYSRGSIRNQFVHVMSATARWIQRLQGRLLEPHLSYEGYKTILGTRQQWNASFNDIREYLATLDEQKLREVVHWELPARNMSSLNQRTEILLHVLNHATDHRAQILAMLHYSFHAKTVEQDLIFYLASDQMKQR